MTRRTVRMAIAGIAAAGALILGMAGAPAMAAGTSPTTGAIAGAVTDAATGEPLHGDIDVWVEPTAGGDSIEWSTSYDGSYKVTGLAPGMYRVWFAPTQYGGYQDEYAGQFWNGTTDDSAATVVTVTSGSTTSGISAAMQPESCAAQADDSTAVISGQVSVPAGFDRSSVQVMLYPASNTADFQWVKYRIVRTDGSYCLTGVEPGSYKVQFSTPGLMPDWWSDTTDPTAATVLTATAGHTSTGVNAAMDAGASIAGTVTSTQVSAGKAPDAQACATLQNSPGGQTVSGCGAIAKSGAYRITGLPAGAYKVSYNILPGCGEWDGSVLVCNRVLWWNGRPSASTATLLTLADHQQRTGVDDNLEITDGVSTWPTASTKTPRVGVKITATPGEWAPGTSFKYHWASGSGYIAGATSSSFTPTAAQLGKTLWVDVAGLQPGETKWQLQSLTFDVPVAAGTLTGATPTISGTRAVGFTLTANHGTWTSGTSFSYAWYANGVYISGTSGATHSTFKPTSAQIGKQISVKVTGSKAGTRPHRG